MSFEEATGGADAVVLGRVVESPETAVYDAASRNVLRQHRVRVEEYFKGQEPSEIIVATFGGRFEAKVDGQLRVLEADCLGEPQLPPVGEQVILFLKSYGGEHSYILYSASHAILRIEAGDEAEEPHVFVRFRNPSAMTPGARQDHDRAVEAGYSGRSQLFRDRIAPREIKTLVLGLLDQEPTK